MKNTLIAVAALLTLAACASDKTPSQQQSATAQAAAAGPTMQLAQVDNIDGTVEVAYRCNSPEGQKNITAMYGMKDGTLVLAQMKINGQISPGLYRVLNDANGERQNSYYGEGITWITGKATPANARSINGNMLTQAQALDANGQPTGTQQVLLQACQVDRAATAALQPKPKK